MILSMPTLPLMTFLEMRRVEGTVVFGDRVGYCPQIAWIQVSIFRGFRFVMIYIYLECYYPR